MSSVRCTPLGLKFVVSVISCSKTNVTSNTCEFWLFVHPLSSALQKKVSSLFQFLWRYIKEITAKTTWAEDERNFFFLQDSKRLETVSKLSLFFCQFLTLQTVVVQCTSIKTIPLCGMNPYGFVQPNGNHQHQKRISPRWELCNWRKLHWSWLVCLLPKI